MRVIRRREALQSTQSTGNGAVVLARFVRSNLARPCQLLMGPSLQGCPCSPTTSAPLRCSASATAAQ
uniref:Uncharacterized protein n=1 Tax=Aegilops tauschii subsp. strangulata TaxID=200361 RepID=A0A453NCF3_AEGTS